MASPSLIVVAATRANAEAAARAIKTMLRIPAEAVATANVVELARTAEVAVVLLNIEISEGLPLMRRLRATTPGIRLIPYGVAPDPREIGAWLSAGACTHVLRDANLDEVLDTAAGVWSDVQSRPTLRSPEHGATEAMGRGDWNAAPQLTPREREVLSLIGAGLTNAEIATAISVEVTTVKNHVQRVFRKLGIHSRSVAAHYAAAEEMADRGIRI